MNIVRIKSMRRSCRRGAALVEFAIVAPVLLLLLVGSIEVGRGINVKNRCAEAARAGARVFSMRKSKTEDDVRGMVDQIMQESNLTNYTTTLDPDPTSEIEQLDPVTVTVSIAAEDASWYPTPWFLTDASIISSSCAMPADLGESSSDDNSPGVPDEKGPILDDDPVEEPSGVTAPDLKDMEKVVRELVKEARELRKEADELQEKADKKAAKAREKGKAKDLEKAQKAQAEAQKADKKAKEAEQRARDAQTKFTKATTGRK
jgi:hypothetical protein